VVKVHGDLHVIPGDVAHLVGSLLDLDLFNVSALQRMGGGWPTDGTDPMSQAVTRLTAHYRTLFVVAAGNSGPGQQTVRTRAWPPPP
jgi:hypothetical protein